MTGVFELKRELRRVQEQRRLAKQRHELAMAPSKRRLEEITMFLHKTTMGQRLNQHVLYQDFLEDVLGPCREKDEYRLVEATHMVDINQKLLELLVQQFRSLTEEMVNEINTMQEESRVIKETYLRRSSWAMEEMTHLNDSFGKLPNLEERRRSSCGGGGRRSSSKNLRRASSVSSTKASDNLDDDSEMSVMSDLSMTFGTPNKPSMSDLSDEQTYTSFDDYSEERRHIKDAIPEEERFTVIKL